MAKIIWDKTSIKTIFGVVATMVIFAWLLSMTLNTPFNYVGETPDMSSDYEPDVDAMEQNSSEEAFSVSREEMEIFHVPEGRFVWPEASFWIPEAQFEIFGWDGTSIETEDFTIWDRTHVDLWSQENVHLWDEESVTIPNWDTEVNFDAMLPDVYGSYAEVRASLDAFSQLPLFVNVVFWLMGFAVVLSIARMFDVSI